MLDIKSNTALSKDTRHIDQTDLTRQAALGNVDAQRALADHLFDRIRRTISYVVGYGMDAEDVAQNAMIAILRSAGSFRGECSLEFWADRVAVYTAAKHLEKKQRRKNIDDRTYVPPLESTLAEDEVESLRAKRKLSIHLSHLSLNERVAMVMHYLNGYNISQVAQLTSCKVNTVRGRLRNGRKKLKKKVLADPFLNSWMKEKSICARST